MKPELNFNFTLYGIAIPLLYLKGQIARSKYCFIEVLDLSHHLGHPFVHRQVFYRGAGFSALKW